MVLKGDLETINLPDVLQLLEGARKTGALSIRRHLEEKRLYFKQGTLVFASSTDDREKLGSVLLSLNLVKGDKLEEARRVQGKTGQRLGIVLLEMGLITRDELVTALKEQVQRIITALFEWWGGQFEFLEGSEPFPDEILVGFKLGGILMEAAKTVDEWSRVYSVMPNVDAVVELEGSKVPEEVTITKEEWTVLSLVDGCRTITEITEVSPFTDIETCKILAGFVERGLAKCRVAAAYPEDKRSRRTDDGPVNVLLTLYNELFTQVAAFVRENAGESAVRNLNEMMFDNFNQAERYLRDCWMPLRGGIDCTRVSSNLRAEDPEDREKRLQSSLFRLFQIQLAYTGQLLTKPQQASLILNIETLSSLLLKERGEKLGELTVRDDIMNFLNPRVIVTYGAETK